MKILVYNFLDVNKDIPFVQPPKRIEKLYISVLFSDDMFDKSLDYIITNKVINNLPIKREDIHSDKKKLRDMTLNSLRDYYNFLKDSTKKSDSIIHSQFYDNKSDRFFFPRLYLPGPFWDRGYPFLVDFLRDRIIRSFIYDVLPEVVGEFNWEQIISIFYNGPWDDEIKPSKIDLLKFRKEINDAFAFFYHDSKERWENSSRKFLPPLLWR